MSRARRARCPQFAERRGEARRGRELTRRNTGAARGVSPRAASRPGRRARRTTTATATWNGTVVARSDDTVVVEGNHYFPREALSAETRDNPQTSVCPWKGTASYLDLVVDGQVNEGAAWYYPQPKEAAAEIRDRVAFWKDVVVTDD